MKFNMLLYRQITHGHGHSKYDIICTGIIFCTTDAPCSLYSKHPPMLHVIAEFSCKPDPLPEVGLACETLGGAR